MLWLSGIRCHVDVRNPTTHGRSFHAGTTPKGIVQLRDRNALQACVFGAHGKNLLQRRTLKVEDGGSEIRPLVVRFCNLVHHPNLNELSEIGLLDLVLLQVIWYLKNLQMIEGRETGRRGKG